MYIIFYVKFLKIIYYTVWSIFVPQERFLCGYRDIFICSFRNQKYKDQFIATFSLIFMDLFVFLPTGLLNPSIVLLPQNIVVQIEIKRLKLLSSQDIPCIS